jgi:hypothetical protein
MRRAGIAETSIGIFILLLLVAIAGGVYVTQSLFDPGLFSVSPPGEDSGAGRKSSLPVPGRSPIPAYIPENLIPLGPEETFNSETLSDKIDGKAELYLSSGFVKLSTRRFARKADPKNWIELFIYEMRDSSGAFSVFSVQKRKESKRVDLDVPAYATGDAFFLVNGQQYIEMIAASTDLAEDMAALARNFVGAAPKNTGEQTEASLFPPESLDKSSISLHMSDVFGFSELDRVYTARYVAGAGEVTAFISKRSNPEEAAGLASSYGRFLLENGGTEEGVLAGAPGSKIYKVFDTFDVVFNRGEFLAGTHEADSLENAKDIALRIYRKLGEGGK